MKHPEYRKHESNNNDNDRQRSLNTMIEYAR